MCVPCRGTPFQICRSTMQPTIMAGGLHLPCGETLPLCGQMTMGLLLSCEVAALFCGDHEANCSKGHGADTPERRGCTEHRRPGMGRSQQAKGTLL